LGLLWYIDRNFNASRGTISRLPNNLRPMRPRRPECVQFRFTGCSPSSTQDFMEGVWDVLPAAECPPLQTGGKAYINKAYGMTMWDTAPTGTNGLAWGWWATYYQSDCGDTSTASVNGGAGEYPWSWPLAPPLCGTNRCRRRTPTAPTGPPTAAPTIATDSPTSAPTETSPCICDERGCIDLGHSDWLCFTVGVCGSSAAYDLGVDMLG